MSRSGISAFDSTLQTTHTWLNEVSERMGWLDKHRAYHALRAVLHALRDRLPVDQVAALGAQLPLLIRGLYYEGWHPAGKPLKERRRDEFAAHIAATYGKELDADPEHIARAVLGIVAKHVSAGEIETIKQALPAEIRTLWPAESPRREEAKAVSI
jgi:uncharacterized protein (DUF2267 family)